MEPRADLHEMRFNSFTNFTAGLGERVAETFDNLSATREEANHHQTPNADYVLGDWVYSGLHDRIIDAFRRRT
jgi:hypothetical protein